MTALTCDRRSQRPRILRLVTRSGFRLRRPVGGRGRPAFDQAAPETRKAHKRIGQSESPSSSDPLCFVPFMSAKGFLRGVIKTFVFLFLEK